MSIKKFIKKLFGYNYKFNSKFPFSGIYIRVRKGKKTTTIALKDTVGRHIWPTNISSALSELDSTTSKYIHIRAYTKYGIMVYYSNDFNKPFYTNENRGFTEVTIPIEEYVEEVREMLQSINKSRSFYENNMMNDIEADLYNNSLVISSNNCQMDIKLYKVAGSLPSEDELQYSAYVLSKISEVNWYIMKPLPSTSVSTMSKSNIIVTAEQLVENIMPPVEFFNIDPLVSA